MTADTPGRPAAATGPEAALLERMDPELAAVVPLIPSLPFTDPVQARRSFEELLASIPADRSLMDRLHVEDRHVPGPPGDPDVMVRVYRPRGAAGPLGAALWIHGGGFVIGSVQAEELGAAQAALAAGAVVVSVEYRLAPEHPFPAPVEDCYAALVWLAGAAEELDVDRWRLAVAGTSAGGGLAAAVALMARDRGGPPLCFQLLNIPELDDRLDTPSMRAFTHSPMWNRPNAVRSWRYYLGREGEAEPGDDVSPYAAPSRATDLAGLPPAYVATAELDPLRDEGILYALAMLAAGVPVELHQFPGTFHGSALVTGAAVSRRQQSEIQRALGDALAPPAPGGTGPS